MNWALVKLSSLSCMMHELYFKVCARRKDSANALNFERVFPGTFPLVQTLNFGGVIHCFFSHFIPLSKMEGEGSLITST